MFRTVSQMRPMPMFAAACPPNPMMRRRGDEGGTVPERDDHRVTVTAGNKVILAVLFVVPVTEDNRGRTVAIAR